MAWEYGPMAFGAFSVEIIFLPSDVYMLPHVFRLVSGEVIVLLISGLCKFLVHRGDMEKKIISLSGYFEFVKSLIPHPCLLTQRFAVSQSDMVTSFSTPAF